MLGVDTVTDTIVIGNGSGRPMGKGPGKDGTIDLIDFVL